MVCPYCQKEYFHSGSCPRCGRPGVCPQCGSPADGNFCSRCGTKIPFFGGPVPDSSNKNKWAAFFLCLFLGMLGIHRFYVGKVGTGILWILLFVLTSKLWILLVLVDLIMIVMGKFRDKQGFYLR